MKTLLVALLPLVGGCVGQATATPEEVGVFQCHLRQGGIYRSFQARTIKAPEAHPQGHLAWELYLTDGRVIWVTGDVWCER